MAGEFVIYWLIVNKAVRGWVAKLHKKKAEYLFNLIGSFLKKNGKIMDLGCGSGVFTKRLFDEGFKVTPVDVVAKLKIEGIQEIIYDGKHLPFVDKAFDQVLLITVLHHVPHYQELLTEVARVTREIVIVEDVYKNGWEKFWICVWDSILNLEFFGHPHNNRSDKEWRAIFEKMGFGIKESKNGMIREIIYGFRQKAYWLQVS